VQFHDFSEDYVRRLTAGDRFVEEHFTAYFGELVYVKLRARGQSRDSIEDVRQETFVRVLATLRKEGLKDPKRLGPFVNSVCNNVLKETARNGTRHSQMSQEADDWLDRRIDLDAPLINQERKRLVAAVLAELPQRDQDLLRMVFFEEVSKAEACRRLVVSEDYLRVLLHRAISRCRDKVAKRGAAA